MSRIFSGCDVEDRHLTANEPIRVEILGAPAACGTEVKDRWRELSGWIADQLRRRYGRAVLARYHDLFDADCPPLPPDAQLPLVLVNGSVLSSGGKLNTPAISRAVEALDAPRSIPSATPPAGAG